jgi:isoleucyl-tRNA synthetase
MENARDREKRILNNWKENNTFASSVKNREGAQSFVFYDGPPTANGMPHIGHVLGRVMKDTIARYKTMSGYHVLRKAGWDTHGLPVELGVEKALGISGKHQIEDYGVEAFINACKDSVFQYEKEWRELTEAIGYWVDMDHPYMTLDNTYIEAVWGLLSTIHKKGLLTQGHRVSPYCPCCQTTLSSHEVDQGYEDVKDLSVTAKFKLNDDDAYLLAWTTTPWTLPGNIALCVNKTLSYARVLHDGERYIVAESLVESVFKSNYEVISTFLGEELVGKTYTPPFTFVKPENAYVIVCDDFVSDKSGTGIVHMAPGYGEDDYRVVRDNNLSFVHIADTRGNYVDEIVDLKGRFVKECDVDIVKMLASSGLLFDKNRFEHRYPHCWRCKSPLLYYACDSWFIRVTAMKDQLIEQNKTITWMPGHVGEGRFGNFLEELVDWNISRNRYWGTPLNVWQCACGNQFCPGSIEELRLRSTTPFDTLELHKPYVDAIKVRCDCGDEMTRTSEVIDVWFDSGAMPFAQHAGMPELAQSQLPADIICEGIDQTRGWFYSLLAISTLVTGKSSYKRAMALGHVLDEKGQKMSKSKGNVIDPWEIIQSFGTDAFRWSLLSNGSPWQPKKFSKDTVLESKSKVVDTLSNVHGFYQLYAGIDGFDANGHAASPIDSRDLLDRWMLARTHECLQSVFLLMENYDFTAAAKKMERVIDDLSNWYLRRSRSRFWGESMCQDKIDAYHTLRETLVLICQMAAPLIPFVTEDIHLTLTGESVHLCDFPAFDGTLVDASLLEQMSIALSSVELARKIRNDYNLRNRQPLASMTLIGSTLVDERIKTIICDEMNIKTLHLSQSDSDYADIKLKLNLKVGGKKYGKEVPGIQSMLATLSSTDAATVIQKRFFEGVGMSIPLDDLLVEKFAKENLPSESDGSLTVVLDTKLTADLISEGLVREVIRSIQDERKRLDLPVEKRVEIVISTTKEVQDALSQFDSLLRGNVLATSIAFENVPNMQELRVLDHPFKLAIQ